MRFVDAGHESQLFGGPKTGAGNYEIPSAINAFDKGIYREVDQFRRNKLDECGNATQVRRRPPSPKRSGRNPGFVGGGCSRTP